jgi:hypothetical protein
MNSLPNPPPNTPVRSVKRLDVLDVDIAESTAEQRCKWSNYGADKRVRGLILNCPAIDARD